VKVSFVGSVITSEDKVLLLYDALKACTFERENKLKRAKIISNNITSNTKKDDLGSEDDADNLMLRTGKRLAYPKP
jgi:hypothetical protein